jgi:hypothetical protein
MLQVQTLTPPAHACHMPCEDLSLINIFKNGAVHLTVPTEIISVAYKKAPGLP